MMDTIKEIGIKIIKSKLFITIATVFLVVVIFRSFGWRFFGFTFCHPPEKLRVREVYVTNDSVFIDGWTLQWAGSDEKISFSGYTYTVKDNNLYIGLKADYLNQTYGHFEIKLDIDTTDINKIYFRNRNHSKDKLVWSKRNDGINFEKIERIRIYDYYDVPKFYSGVWWEDPNIPFEYADKELVEKIKHPKTTRYNVDYLDDHHYAVAETTDGDTIILEIAKDYSCFQVMGSTTRHYFTYDKRGREGKIGQGTK